LAGNHKDALLPMVHVLFLRGIRASVCAAEILRARVELAVRAVVAADWIEQVVGAIGTNRLVGLLALEARLRQVDVAEARRDLFGEDRL
jgi:hypothetical protein